MQDGYSDAFNFSTGRRNVASLHTIFTLQPRHDFLQWAFQTGKTLIDLHYRPADDIQLDFKLFKNALPDNFVWAIIAKDELLSVKDGRWDLVCPFTLALTNTPLIPSCLTTDVRKDHRERGASFLPACYVRYAYSICSCDPGFLNQRPTRICGCHGKPA